MNRAQKPAVISSSVAIKPPTSGGGYKATEDKSHWSRWSKSNIVGNPFTLENVDYVGFAIMANGNETTDFALTIDLAKKGAKCIPTTKIF